jgi:hypothetical protein
MIYEIIVGSCPPHFEVPMKPIWHLVKDLSWSTKAGTPHTNPNA